MSGCITESSGYRGGQLLELQSNCLRGWPGNGSMLERGVEFNLWRITICFKTIFFIINLGRLQQFLALFL